MIIMLTWMLQLLPYFKIHTNYPMLNYSRNVFEIILELNFNNWIFVFLNHSKGCLSLIYSEMKLLNAVSFLPALGDDDELLHFIPFCNNSIMCFSQWLCNGFSGFGLWFIFHF